MGLLSGPMLLFCSSQPHRPYLARARPNVRAGPGYSAGLLAGVKSALPSRDRAPSGERLGVCLCASEEPHHVRLRWGTPVHQCVGINERQVLALLTCASASNALSPISGLGVHVRQEVVSPGEVVRVAAGHMEPNHVKSRRESAAGFIVVLDSGGSAMNIRYRVDLSDLERTHLTALLHGGKHAARKIKRAQILLAADAGVSDHVTASSLSVGGSTVYRTKRRFVQGNLELALSEQARPGASRKLSGKEAALLIATSDTASTNRRLSAVVTPTDPGRPGNRLLIRPHWSSRKP
jgi:hypothetical protein